MDPTATSTEDLLSNGDSKPCFVLALPNEIQIQILAYLDITEQALLSKTCQHWRRLLKTEVLIRTRYSLRRNPKGLKVNYLHDLIDIYCATVKFHVSGKETTETILLEADTSWATANILYSTVEPPHAGHAQNLPFIDEPMCRPPLSSTSKLDPNDDCDAKLHQEQENKDTSDGDLSAYRIRLVRLCASEPSWNVGGDEKSYIWRGVPGLYIPIKGKTVQEVFEEGARCIIEHRYKGENDTEKEGAVDNVDYNLTYRTMIWL
ncbi:hypothetical protein H072_6497 [Dactylellina haptotyla CBS 200.50]|uniref:F-box domain-containing protein n=1 Tax=Dactylellina haptotyla (strain CBS 200.50) TaxID=1284197 RepID=S8BWK3_DACHA|nr:hypothetical protein H072_6497 [Dactylellina haptotyla CBS 200.50]